MKFIALLVAVAFAVRASAATGPEQDISQFPRLTTPTVDDLLPIWDWQAVGQKTKAITAANLRTFMQQGLTGGSVGSGTLTNVVLVVPTSLFDVTHLNSGGLETITVSLDAQAANTVWAGPTSGGAGPVTSRFLVPADIPGLSALKLTSDIVPPARLGSGSPDGTKILYGDSVYRPASDFLASAVGLANFIYHSATNVNTPNGFLLTAGPNMSVDVVDNTIVLTSSGGTASAGGDDGDIQVNNSTALGGTKAITISGGTTRIGAAVVTNSLQAIWATASTVPYFDASKNLVSSAVSHTALGYIATLTNSVQQQIINLIDGKFTRLATPSVSSVFGYHVGDAVETYFTPRFPVQWIGSREFGLLYDTAVFDTNSSGVTLKSGINLSIGYITNMSRIYWTEQAVAPATPDSGKVVTYAKTDGLMYQKDDTGSETVIGGGGGGGAPTTATYVTTTANGSLSAEVVVSKIQEAYLTIQPQSPKLPTSSTATIDASETNWRVLFGASGDESAVYSQQIMPRDYGSALKCDLIFSMASATAGNVVLQVQVMAVTPGDAADVNTESYDTANSATVAVPATAGHTTSTTITLTNADGLAAGDLVKIKITRVGSSGSDTASGNLELLGAQIAYLKQ